MIEFEQVLMPIRNIVRYKHPPHMDMYQLFVYQFVNYLLHTPILGSYKVSNTDNTSTNLVWLYPFTAGFSLHDKHHADPKELSEKTRWFEIDLEYYI